MIVHKIGAKLSMCGITGSVNLTATSCNNMLVRAMTEIIGHRGPDGDGIYASQDHGVVFGHRRLKIIDLSENARQPMSNQDGTVWLTYNGEIYNYQELDAILKAKGYVYRSQSDSETIIHAYEEWGEACIEQFNGMFALAIWDERKKQLFCARDRFGEKPFYYYLDNGKFSFASEIKSLFEDSQIPRTANYQVIARYLQHNETDIDEATFFAGIHSLPASHTLTLRDGKIKIQRYWQLPTQIHQAKTEDEWVREFFELLKDSVRLRLRSDVAVGTCLSGGLDSSSIICLMAQLIDEPISAFSVAYDDKGFSERSFMQAMTDALPIRAHTVIPTGEDLFDTLSQIIWHNDEPSSSTGQYSQWHVMKLAAEKGVTVILNGQGGDELLAGYHRYMPTYVHELMRGGHWRQAAIELNKDAKLHEHSLVQNVKKVFYPSMPEVLKGAYTKILSTQSLPESFLSSDFLTSYATNGNARRDRPSSLREHLAQDLTEKSVPYLVHHEDRCSMAFSREIRLPFLDHRLVELAFHMPAAIKIRGGVTKYVLRQAMKNQGMPETILQRHDKKGYPTPMGKWFRTTARQAVGEVLNSASFKERGIVNTSNALDAFTLHTEGKADFTLPLWQWVNLELWFRKFID
jgi:asparagine synthase (glutamine-hydrolysing)